MRGLSMNREKVAHSCPCACLPANSSGKLAQRYCIPPIRQIGLMMLPNEHGACKFDKVKLNTAVLETALRYPAQGTI